MPQWGDIERGERTLVLMNDALEYAELVKPQKKEGMKEKRERDIPDPAVSEEWFYTDCDTTEAGRRAAQEHQAHTSVKIFWTAACTVLGTALNPYRDAVNVFY
jgi:hypothetical protein